MLRSIVMTAMLTGYAFAHQIPVDCKFLSEQGNEIAFQAFTKFYQTLPSNLQDEVTAFGGGGWVALASGEVATGGINLFMQKKLHHFVLLEAINEPTVFNGQVLLPTTYLGVKVRLIHPGKLPDA